MVIVWGRSVRKWRCGGQDGCEGGCEVGLTRIGGAFGSGCVGEVVASGVGMSVGGGGVGNRERAVMNGGGGGGVDNGGTS